MIGVGALSHLVGRLPAVVVTLAVATPGIQYACGGGSGGGTPTTTPPPTAEPQNPCPATPSAASIRSSFGATSPFVGGKRDGFIDGHAQRTVLDAVWEHRTGLERGFIQPPNVSAETEDVGEIAVLQDEGDLVLTANVYDLRDVTLRFEPNGVGGYDVTRVGAADYRSPVGDQVVLADDDTAQLTFPFEFQYYDRAHGGVWVNSDGNLTFEEGDDASTLRGISRLLTGRPRIAPFPERPRPVGRRCGVRARRRRRGHRHLVRGAGIRLAGEQTSRCR